jgi:mRNA-degrading endonuclease RelE of RelBE toxin-antitoxin system
MTNVRITDRADEQLDSLDSEARERLIGKIGEATERTEHRLSPLTNSSGSSLVLYR